MAPSVRTMHEPCLVPTIRLETVHRAGRAARQPQAVLI